jgi:mannosyltransferase OCH1-like enzyme
MYKTILKEILEEYNLIPKKIHYVWIGGEKSNLVNICINSWREKLPDYEIIEWNEKNFDIEKEIKGKKFLEVCYKKKLWAFISDYMRYKVLYEYGGIYLDTDMQIIKDITPILKEDRYICGYEDDGKFKSAGIICCEKGHPFAKDVLDFYDKDIMESDVYTLPKVMTHILDTKYSIEFENEEYNETFYNDGIHIFNKEYFYPFSYKEEFKYEMITDNTFGIHWWSKSWIKKRDYFLESKHMKGLNKLWKCIKIFGYNTIVSLKKLTK